MLVTFETKAYANITMFGDVAVKLLRMMGHSGTIPSALLAEDVPASLAKLKAAVASEKALEGSAPAQLDDDEEASARVSLGQRAFPLIELLEAAAAKGCDVMWKESRG